jgi:hypothetical protein
MSPADALPLVQPEAGGAPSAILGVVATSRDPDGACAMWRDAFGLAESSDGAGWRFDLGNANLFLRAGHAGAPDQPPDRWEALVLSVSDIEAAASRLRSAGNPVAPATGFDGVEVNACGSRIILTEAR